MADIEFKRRGTPLWAVLLALVVVALAIWLLLGRGGDDAPDTVPPATQPAPGTPATPGAPGAPPTGAAAPGTPVAEFSAFVTGRPAPAVAEIPAYVSDGLRLLAGAMQERFPMSGVQINLVRAMADSLRMPDLSAARQTEMAQAAFFGAAYGMGRGGAGDPVNTAASQVRLQLPLRQQMREVQAVFRAARESMENPAPAAPATPPAGAPPATPKS